MPNPLRYIQTKIRLWRFQKQYPSDRDFAKVLSRQELEKVITKDVDDKIMEAIKRAKISEMKEPEIIMHPDNLETLKKQCEAKIKNFQRSKVDVFAGIPIKTNELIERYNFYVVDAYNKFKITNDKFPMTN